MSSPSENKQPFEKLLTEPAHNLSTSTLPSNNEQLLSSNLPCSSSLPSSSTFNVAPGTVAKAASSLESSASSAEHSSPNIKPVPKPRTIYATLPFRSNKPAVSGKELSATVESSSMPQCVAGKVPPPVSLKKDTKKTSENADSNALPPVPTRVKQCFKKQSSLESAPLKPLPPKPRSRSHTVAARTPAKEWKSTGKTMKLSQLAETESDKLPVKIRLLDGYYGQTSRFTLSASDTFSVHFSKCTQVLTVMDSVGVTYTIPFNSDVMFGIFCYVQNPNATKTSSKNAKSSSDDSNCHENSIKSSNSSNKSVVFTTVKDLFSLEILPNVVCATRSSESCKSTQTTSVKKGEVLIVKGIYKRLGKQRALKCFSVQENCSKLLYENCKGDFSLNAEDTKLHVLEFATHLRKVFPCRVMMFLGTDGYESPTFRNIPKSLFSKPIKLINETKEISLVATSGNIIGDDGNNQGPKLIEIPLDSHLAHLEVEILEPPTEQESERLYENAQAVMAAYDPRHYMVLLDKGSDKVNEAQSAFYMSVRRDRKNVGIEIRASETMYERLQERQKESAHVTQHAVPINFKSKEAEATPKFNGSSPEIKVNVESTIADGYDTPDDEHTYEMIDDEFRRALLAKSTISYPRSSFSPSFEQIHPLTPSQQVSPKHFELPLTSPQSPQYYQSPFSVPAQQPSYVKLFPNEPVNVPTPNTVNSVANVATGMHGTSPEIIAANKQYLSSMSLSNVSILYFDAHYA